MGGVKHLIDFEKLKQNLSDSVMSEKAERYQFTWPEKSKAILLANSPINATLRPCREESVDFDNTRNLYIEGDNLDVLKCLKETYLHKVKMIYIDPPYNTGNDFVYEDDFTQFSADYRANSGQYDEQGNRLVANPESNGRFHTDWLNMIYPRLRVARDLLTDDGVIFISIDDNEVENLKKICNEVFGENNSLGIITWTKKRKGSFLSKGIISLTEYTLVFCKHKASCIGLYGGVANSSESQPIIKRTNKTSILSIPAKIIKTKLPNGKYKAGSYGDNINPIKLLNDIRISDGIILDSFRIEAPFIWSQELFEEQLEKGASFVINTINFQIRVFRIYDEDSFKGFSSIINGVEIKGTNEDAYEELEKLFGIKKLFDYSKPSNYIKEFTKAATHFDKDSLILDFFSGSATTAHAVMQLNAEDGGNRKFIMVQLPEKTDEKSEAYKAGYKNICEIGKERIRRAGKKIKEELQNQISAVCKELDERTKGVLKSPNPSAWNYLFKELNEEQRNRILELQTTFDAKKKLLDNLDTGFRVLKLDSTNMEDIYYSPYDTDQRTLFSQVDNVKPDRTSEDLLFQVMLELGATLDCKIETTTVAGKTIYNVADNYLVACFDQDVSDDVVKAIAQMQPTYAVLRDTSMENDATATNFEQIFKTYSPNTVTRIL